MSKFLVPVDLTRNELRNARTQNLATAPSATGAGDAGLRYFDTGSKKERYWDGTRWVDLSDTINVANITGLGQLATLDAVDSAHIVDGSIMNADVNAAAGIATTKLSPDPLARANHTGTQLANTIGNFDSQVRTSRLDQMAPPTAAVSMNGQLITNVATPVSASDGANKAYVDMAVTGLDVKDSVRAASTANVNLAAPGAFIDGVSLNNGDRVLLKNQTAGAENGIYIFNGAAAAMTRSADADSSSEVTNGMYCLVTAGGQTNTGWILTTPDPITLGTSSLTFSQFSGGTTVYTGTANRITVTGTQIDIAASYVGQASITTLGTISTGTWQATPVGIAYGGTGANSVAGARSNLGITGGLKYATSLATGSTSYTVNHALGTTDVVVALYDNTNAEVYADVTVTDANNVSVAFTVALAAAVRVVVMG